ncbi:RagB/SusD family nutrient uptake outer membrane protein [Mucilaginibacter rigui]|uniref:RagB/SusD family nutrient uptake outer membrane protein n=1 Tax=Mucilaginibacter rigui TaxID=534635 RepID=A0ABR7X5Q3_9SPHI|nr:RagB/SusD family nutrient uptake outer membrane protein [Mucilaginibacter rigui]MBD1385886.1 RagB/SusD family nutrient uptake outer membrane protein [Mucilaginibacter rigui]
MKLKKYSRSTYAILFAIPIMLCLLSVSCKKDFLDKKPDKALLVPTTVQDFQALLNNLTIMNAAPSLNMIAGDEFLLPDDALEYLDISEANSYTWEPFSSERLLDWETPYQQVFYANIILEGVDKLPNDPATQSQRNQLKGNALFFRARAFYNLAQEFSKPYTKASASTDQGIPLRLKSDVNIKSVRASVQQTYDQIITDLNTAKTFLPKKPALNTMASQLSVNALLSRMYLSMSDFTNAKKAADEYLTADNQLIDYNTLSASGVNPFPQSVATGNDEVVFYGDLISALFNFFSPYINPAIYNSFEQNDLRKSLLFVDDGTGNFSFIGDYTGFTYRLFGGLATDEVYLNRAECLARSNDLTAALKDLNLLLTNRYKTGTFTPIVSANADDVLARILLERRKELIARGTRWSDLRRLNLEDKYKTTLSRVVKGKLVSLPPSDNKYVFAIPNNEISGSGIPQNPR